MAEQPKRRRGRTPHPKTEDNITITDKTKSGQNVGIKKPISEPTEEQEEDFEEEPQQQNSEQDIEAHDEEQMKKESTEETVVDEMDEFDRMVQEELDKELNNKSDIDDIPKEDNPLQENVKFRSYTNNADGNAKTENTASNAPEREIEEPNYNYSGKALPDIDDTLVNPNFSKNTKTNFGDIPNSDGGSGGSGGGSNNTNTGSSNNFSGGENKGQPKQTFKKEPSENLRELSPAEKRKSIEKTADGILMAYQAYCPLPFIHFSSFNEDKLEDAHNAKEIDLDYPVNPQGVTFRQHAAVFNSEVEEAFSISDEEVAQLREPLIDVLSEKEIAATPMQRLLMVAVPLLLAKIMLMIKFLRQKNRDMEKMKLFHEERMMELRKQTNIMKNNKRYANAENINPTNYTQQPTDNIKVTNANVHGTQYKPEQPPQQHAQQPNYNPNPNQASPNTQPQKPADEKTVTDAKIVEKPKPDVEKTPTLDDILEEETNKKDTEVEENFDDTDENDIPND